MRFLNDLVVTRDAVYVTDSMNPELVVIPLGHRRGHEGLPASSAARLVPLTGDLVYQDGINLNGIAAGSGVLMSVQSNTGELFLIHPRTGRTHQVDLGGDTVLTGHLDVPSTATFARGSLWAVNARFNTPPTPTTPYWITRLDR